MSKKTNVFKSILKQFETKELREYCEDMIELVDERIFRMPASTTYKYHNETQCKYGGQCYHVLMAATIMNHILELDYIKKNIATTEIQRDGMRTAMILHDSIKTGIDYGSYTVFDHPILAKEWIENTKVEHDVSKEIKKYIGNLVASHSGQWNSSKRSETLLPTPSNGAEFIVHLCDYLGSRSDLDMIYDTEMVMAVEAFTDLPVLEDPREYVMPFGKYKNSTLGEIEENDVQYLNWMKENIKKEPIKSILKKM